MIDLFEIRDYLEFLMKSYPEIKMHLTYNNLENYCDFSIQCNKAQNWYFGTIPANSTDFVISRIDLIFHSFICNDKVKEVLLHGKTRKISDLSEHGEDLSVN